MKAPICWKLGQKKTSKSKKMKYQNSNKLTEHLGKKSKKTDHLENVAKKLELLIRFERKLPNFKMS